MRVTIRATSDLHLTQATAPIVFSALRELRADAQKCDADENVTMILGDVLDQANTVHMPTYNQLRGILQMWPGRVYVLPGNHDQYSKGAGYTSRWHNSLVALDGGSCRVVTQPVWGKYGRFLPYVDPDTWAEELAGIKSAPVGDKFLLPMIWAHNGFRGAYRNAMSIDHDGVSCGAIPKGHIVVTGHYHMPQNLGRIVYCGSPYETTFAEEGQVKGWLRWENALASIVPERVPFKDVGGPRHVTINWDPRDTAEPEAPELGPNDRPRIVTPVSRQEIRKYSEVLERAGLSGIPIVARGKNDTAGRGDVEPDAGPDHAVRQYVCRVVGPDAQQPDPASLLEYADEVGLL